MIGAKAATGVTCGVAADAATGNVAIVEYAEGDNGTKAWVGTSGTVQVESIARESIGAERRAEVLMAPDVGKRANTATGSFTLSGTQQASDLLGFAP